MIVCINYIKNITMQLFGDRTDVSLVSHINKASVPKECDIYHYWYFFKQRIQVSTMFMQ